MIHFLCYFCFIQASHSRWFLTWFTCSFQMSVAFGWNRRKWFVEITWCSIFYFSYIRYLGGMIWSAFESTDAVVHWQLDLWRGLFSLEHQFLLKMRIGRLLERYLRFKINPILSFSKQMYWCDDIGAQRRVNVDSHAAHIAWGSPSGSFNFSYFVSTSKYVPY